MIATVTHDGNIQLWEVASGAELFGLQDAPPNEAAAVQFSPDGRVLGSAMSDGTVLIWSLNPPGWKPPTAPPTAGQRERLWEDLAGEPRQAYRAALTLAADDRAVPFLAKRLPRVEPESLERIQQLISDLDDDSFGKREAASTALGRLASQAEKALRRTARRHPSPEAARRLKALLKRLDSCFLTDPATLREVRAVGVLRRIGTPAACAVLQHVAGGAPQAAQTRAARTALQAIKKQPR